jgi:hypothetical protein
MTRIRSSRGRSDDLEAALTSLTGMRIAALRYTWCQRFGGEPPPCRSADLLRRLIAWRLQEERFGGLPADAKRRLRQLCSAGEVAKTKAAAPLILKPGTMITREWRGVVRRVHVLKDGFTYEGSRYGSLSRIARLITGKRWSGPRFFGIENDKLQLSDDASRRSAGS